MKPAPFEYICPTSLDEAKSLLAAHGDDAKILAGGQTLVPMMNYRLAGPALIVDINEIFELRLLQADAQGLRLGALVRWAQLEHDPVVASANPLLPEAIRHVAHYQIRNRGTWAGSCAHADPAAEFQAVALACDAVFTIESLSGKRSVTAEDFFVAPLTTALEPDEILTEVQFPAWPADRKWAFEEFSFRTGDFAIAGIITLIDSPSAAGEQHRCRIVCFGLGDRAIRLHAAEGLLNTDGLSAESIARAAEVASEEIEPQDDPHASAEYRRAVVKALVGDVLHKALGLEVMT